MPSKTSGGERATVRRDADPELARLYERVGTQIRQLRERAGLTQREVAEGVLGDPRQQGSVSRWERGQWLPQLGTLHKLAIYFGVSLAELGLYEPEERISDAELARAVELLEEALVLLRGRVGSHHRP